MVGVFMQVVLEMKIVDVVLMIVEVLVEEVMEE